MAVMGDTEDFDCDQSDYSGESVSDRGDSDGEVRNDEPPTKKIKPGKKAKQKTRSRGGLLKGLKNSEELRTLSDFETNVVLLQMNEVLKEVAFKEKRRQAAMAWFNQLKDALINAKVTKKHVLKLKTPLRPLPEDPQLADFVYIPPKDVSIVGSFAYETAVKWSCMDVAVEMPASCFARWDYHNVKYQRKRALYLTYIAAALQKQPALHSGLRWQVAGDDRLPHLIVTSPNANLTAIIRPYPEEGLFQASRFAPDKLNVQEKFLQQPADSRRPVPIYNGGVLQDLLMLKNRDSFSDLLKASTGVRGGIQVLKLWLKSRGLSDGPDGFTGFALTAYVDHLLRSGRVNSIMGLYQVVRAVLAQLQAEDWLSDRLLPTGAGCETAKEAHKLMVERGAAAVLIDRVSSVHNVLYRISPATIEAVRAEARAALQTLNSGSINLINELFSSEPVSFYRKFDYYARIELSPATADLKRCGDPDESWIRADFGGSQTWPTSRDIMATMRRALGRRVSLLGLRPLTDLEWDLGAEFPEESTCLEVGWNLDPDEVHHIEKGPPADSPEAVEFREFWGDKCEIRRFQDGSILETVVWPGETAEDRKAVTQNIAEYILRRRHNRIRKIAFSGEVCDRFLRLPNCHFAQRYDTGDDQLVEINTKFNELAKILRKLPDLPADVSTVQGLSEELCYTAVFPQLGAACDSDSRVVTHLNGRCVPKPGSQAVPKLVVPIDVLLVVESSKWPDDLDALQGSKTAFYLALARGLEGRECQVFEDHLLLLFHGLLFRVRVSCAKEIFLAKQVVSTEGMVKHVENRATNQLEFEHAVLPRLVSALHGLHLQHSTFGPACRLAKRWLASHLLSDAFPWLAVDLMVASCYIQPLPLSLPHSSRGGFQRFLNLLASFDWRLNPLIVNFNNQLSPEEIQQRTSHFTRNRASLPPLFISTPFNQKENSWVTIDNPIGPALQRAVTLARKSLAFIEAQLAEGRGLGGAFKSALEVYDFVIQLDPRAMATHHLSLGAAEKLTFTKKRDEISVADFDPVRLYVEDLKAAYGHLCVFFYDKFGGTDIGGLWIPRAQAPLPFKIRNLSGRKLTEPAKVLTPNYSAILSDLKVLGQGLVKDIVEQRCPTTFNRTRKDSR